MCLCLCAHVYRCTCGDKTNTYEFLLSPKIWKLASLQTKLSVGTRIMITRWLVLIRKTAESGKHKAVIILGLAVINGLGHIHNKTVVKWDKIPTSEKIGDILVYLYLHANTGTHIRVCVSNCKYIYICVHVCHRILDVCLG